MQTNKGGIEISLDRNFYTGGNLTPTYLKKLEASRQFTASTSELGKILSAYTQIPFTGEKGKENKRVLTPIQADHLMHSLGGSIATSSMFFTNLIFNKDRPETQLKENPLLGGIIGAGEEWNSVNAPIVDHMNEISILAHKISFTTQANGNS